VDATKPISSSLSPCLSPTPHDLPDILALPAFGLIGLHQLLTGVTTFDRVCLCPKAALTGDGIGSFGIIIRGVFEKWTTNWHSPCIATTRRNEEIVYYLLTNIGKGIHLSSIEERGSNWQ